MRERTKHKTASHLCILIFDHVSSMPALLKWLSCDTTCL